MTKKHLKRLAAPKSWPIERKKTKFITRANPGPHKLKESIPLNIFFKDLLKYTNTTKETKLILNEGKILVNNIPRKSYKFPIGIFDTIQLPTKEYFRLFYNKNGKFILHKITKEEVNIIPYKIVKKTLLKNKKIQLNFHNGKNILIEKDEYKPCDTVLLDDKNKIKTHIELEKNVLIYLIAGKHISKTGILQSISKTENLQPDKIILKIKNKNFTTLKKYAFVIGKEKPIFSLPDEQSKK